MDAEANNSAIAGESSATQPTWPLQFVLKLPEPRQQGAAGHSPPEAGVTKQIWWSYDLYRGPRNQKPKVLYARSKAEAEEIAQGFLQEDVLGFDMEWPCFDGDSRNEDRLQDKVGLIAIACETKIALFHLGAYTGKKPRDFIGPELRAIIESPRIKKAGVNILAADFGRLREWFELEPQGAVELSHLHNLDNYGRSGQTSHCTTRLCALDKLVQTYLHFPLKKSSVRTSNWGQKKQLSREQKAYAASDAYAGFMLYHCLNSLRQSIEPSPPPPPLYAERYKWIELPRRGTALLLELDNPGKEGTLEVISAVDHFEGHHDNIHTVTITSSMMPTKHNAELEDSRTASPAPIQEKTARQPERHISQHTGSQRRKNTSSRKRTDPLLQALKVHRGKIAKQRRLDTWKVVHNSALKLIAQHKPENERSLMEIKGVGPQTVKKYGAAILNIVALHAAGDRQSTENEQSDKEADPNADGSNILVASESSTNLTETAQNISHGSETSQFDTDPPCAPQGKGLDRGGPSQSIVISDEDDIATLETPSRKTVKRRTAQTR
ncbi:hypothetical protein INS49_007191 [Diaporthe citri]|uniref:uncharacterized protein n=1 Tax=Diaporthe citri TaxID=83186 RepID=UPI001C7F083B|nr:uncharacterized protein INS49_007191 [Diaporthe citri]KAG6365580.1 hypothetical protein INS49_007191 [Diaporthe citri]